MKKIYTDGSCLDNGLPTARGGWSFVVLSKDEKIKHHEDFGKIRYGRQTGNRAEMESFLQALLWIDSQNNSKEKFTIHCDSKTIVDGVRGIARREANRDIWEQIEFMCAKLVGRIDVEDSEGHVDEWNIYCDKLAKQGANSLLKAPVNINIEKEVM